MAQRLVELRSFSSSAFLRAEVGNLRGASQFTAQIMLRYLGPTATAQFLAGNRDGNTGWCIRRLPDSGATLVNLEFTVYELNVAHTLTIQNLESIYGKLISLTMRYDGNNIDAYINGVKVGSVATAGDTMSLSSGQFSIGYDVNAAVEAAVDESFIGFAFKGSVSTDDAIASNQLELIQLFEPTSTFILWTTLYSLARNAGAGVPSFLRNSNNDTIAERLEVVGRTLFTFGIPINYIGDATKQSTGGGGAVTSVFGRVGVVTAQAGDYTSTLITNSSTVPGATVTDALDALQTSSGVSSVFGRTGAVVAISGDYTASQVTNTSGVVGATVADALDTLNVAAPVSSVFGRTGVVVAVSGDYTSTLITNSSTVPGATVTAALNSLLAGSGVSSVFGRTGAVVSVAGDYTSTQITNSSGVAGATVTDALNALNVAAPVTSVFGRTGVVVAVSGDYTSTLITNSSTVPGATVTAALDNLSAGSGVSSVFGRTGAVVAVAGDYTSTLVTNSSTVVGATVTAALDTLQTTKITSPGTSTNLAIPTWNGVLGAALNDSAVRITGATTITASTALTVSADASVGGLIVSLVGGAATNGTGGSAQVTGGAGGGVNQPGGNALIFGGAPTGTGTGGNVVVQGADNITAVGGTITARGGAGSSAANDGLVQIARTSANRATRLSFVADDSNTISIKAPTTATSYALIWPTAQGGAGTVLQNDGSGTLSWVSSGAITTPATTTLNAVSTWGDILGDSLLDTSLTVSGTAPVTISTPDNNIQLSAGGTAARTVLILGGTGPNNGIGGVVTVRGGTGGTGTGATGGAVNIQGGTGGAAGFGGNVNITGGTGTGTNTVGGNVVITGGVGSGTGIASVITITAGSSAASTDGGSITLTSGSSGIVSPNPAGAVVTLFGGNSGVLRGGDITLQGGQGGGGSGPGGIINILGGPGRGSSALGGAVNITAGNGGTTSGAGGPVNITGGTSTSGIGGAVSVTAGNSTGTNSGAAVTVTASNGIGTDQNGGNIVLRPGLQTGTGTVGTVQINPINAGQASVLRGDGTRDIYIGGIPAATAAAGASVVARTPATITTTGTNTVTGGRYRVSTSGGAIAAVNLPNPNVSAGQGIDFEKITTDTTNFTFISPAGNINGISGATGLTVGVMGRQGFSAWSDGTDWYIHALGGTPATATATGTINTTSATDVLATSMTITPGAGTYRVTFTGTVEAPNLETVTASIYNGGAQATATERSVKGDAGTVSTTEIGSFACECVITVAAATAVEGRWRTTGGTANMFNRTLVLTQII